MSQSVCPLQNYMFQATYYLGDGMTLKENIHHATIVWRSPADPGS